MKLLPAILAATVVVAAGASHAQVARDAATPTFAESAPDSFIHGRLERMFSQFVEIGDASPQAWSGRTALNAVATKAREAEWPGLCEATVAEFWPDRETPLSAHEAFKVVGSLAPVPSWTPQVKADLTARCANAGRVLSSGDLAYPEMFFVESGPPVAGAWLAARALEVALQQARDGKVVICPVHKAENSICQDALSKGGSLSLQRLIKVKEASCKNADQNCIHVNGEFFISADRVGGRTWLLNLDAKIKTVDRYVRDVEAVTNVNLGGSGWIF